MSPKITGCIQVIAICCLLVCFAGNSFGEYPEHENVFDVKREAIERNAVPLLNSTPGTNELIQNGNFETGDFTGWTVQDTGSGNWVVFDENFDPQGPGVPEKPFAGKFGAITDQTGPGTHDLFQDITLAPGTATLSFVDKIDNWAGVFDPNLQVYRVQILDPTSSNVLQTLFETQPGDPPNTPYTQRQFDISAFAGQTIRVRFTEIDNLFFFDLRLDNVSVTQSGGAPTLNLTGRPNPAQVGHPFTLFGDFDNQGGSFVATFRLYFIDNSVHQISKASGIPIPAGFNITGFPAFFVPSFPQLPRAPFLGFLLLLFNTTTGELLASDLEIVGITVAPSAAEVAAIEEIAAQWTNRVVNLTRIGAFGDVAAAPPLQEVPLEGKFSFPIEPKINSKRKLSTTWGGIKSKY